MAKKVKIAAQYAVTHEETITLWGVKFEATGEGKPAEQVYVGEVDEDLAKEMIDNGRCVKFDDKAPAAGSSKKDVDFASEEAGEVHATMVKDKKLTAKEYKKIEGTGTEGAITVGDLDDYIATRDAAKAPPAPAKVTK